jgi:hypothetical protein
MYYLSFLNKVTGELCPTYRALRLEMVLSELTHWLGNDYASPNWTSVARSLEHREPYKVDNLYYAFKISSK